MTDDERIEYLIEHPPTPAKQSAWLHKDGGWVPWEIVYRVSAAIAVAAMVVACIAAIATAQQSSCINRILGARSDPAYSDSQANVNFAVSLQTVLTLPTTLSQEQKIAALGTFVHSVSDYVDTLVSNQQFRANHPLGKC